MSSGPVAGDAAHPQPGSRDRSSWRPRLCFMNPVRRQIVRGLVRARRLIWSFNSNETVIYTGWSGSVNRPYNVFQLMGNENPMGIY